MLHPCPKRILCPTGTSAEGLGGTNYSSEHVDVPEYSSIYYPPTNLGTYTACQGRCISLISQEDANLCAQRLAKICLNSETNGKPTFGNTVQICNLPSTGRTVIVPADSYFADSVAEANAQALSYANEQQQNPTLPPVHNVPPPSTDTGGGGITPNIIPVGTPVPTRQPPPPPSSQCKPCDDSAAVASFNTVCVIPAATYQLSWESPPLKCGRWSFQVITNDGGSIDDPPSYITLVIVANDPSRSYVDWGSFEFCEQMAYQNPCGGTPGCDPLDTAAFGKVQSACCSDTAYDCRYLECQTIGGNHYMCRLQINYVSNSGAEVPFSKQFTVQGTLIAPLPTP